MTDQRKQAAGAASLSPYELVFGAPVFEEQRFPAIRAEAEARGVETDVPERFLLLASVGLLLQELLPEGAGREEFSRVGQLLYQAYHFWREGKPGYRLSEGEARELVRRHPGAEGWSLAPPAPSGYLELPRHLFWARIEEGATPEPVAGFFWTVCGPAEVVDRAGGLEPALGPESAQEVASAGGVDAPRHLELLLVLGLFPGRPGFSTIALETPLERGDPFPATGARPEGEDFANILPGGELQDWYGLITELEVWKLVSRCFAELARGGDER
jgi:hypothetical protein